MTDMNTQEKPELEEERSEVLHELEDWLETPMLVLSFVWLVLLLIELIWGLNPMLEIIGTAIWIVFILDFALRFTLAPHKLDYLKNNSLTAVSLLAPALRILRIVRPLRLLLLTRTTRGLRLLRVVSSLHRGMRALSASLGRRGFGYVVLLSLVITSVGAAGMYAFENNPAGRGLNSYGDALWWTAMIMTTLGSEFWPQTAEGRILCVILSLYAFTVFGYVAATLATFFIDRDAENEESQVAGAKSIKELRNEIELLRTEIRLTNHRGTET